MITFREFSKDVIHTNIRYYWKVYKLIVNIANMNEVDALLGFGAGDFTFEKLLKNQFDNLDITVVDFENISDNKFKYYNNLSEITSKFDLITSLECLYLLNDDQLISHSKQIYNLLNDNGIYIFTNGFNSYNPNLKIRMKEAIEMYKHIPLYPYPRDSSEYIDIFTNSGFKIGVKTIGSSIDIPFFGILNDSELNNIEKEFAEHRIFVCYKSS